MLVEEEDRKVEMDKRQRSRQMWLSTGNANARFFHLTEKGRRKSNQISKVQVGHQECVKPQVI